MTNNNNDIIHFELELEEKYYDWMVKGNREKTIEGRKKNGSWSYLDIGMIGYLIKKNSSERKKVIINKIICYTSLRQFLEEHLKECLPNVATIEEGIKEYEKIFKLTEEQIDKEYGGMQGIMFNFLE